MKKTMAILFGLMLMLSVFAFAEADTQTETNTGDTETPDSEGASVTTGTGNTATEDTETPDSEETETETPESEETETETEIETETEVDDMAPVSAATTTTVEQDTAAVEAAPTGDAVVADVEADVETDAQIEQDLGITASEQADIDAAVKNPNVGLRQYILNRQLKARVHVAVVHGENIIRYLDNKKNDSSTLKPIVDELKAAFDSIDAKSMTKDQYTAKVTEVKALVTKFREAIKTLIPDSEKPKLRKDIEAAGEKDAEAGKLAKLEWKARMLYNRKQFSKAMNEFVKDAKELRKDGIKLMATSARIKALKQIKDKYENGNMTSEEVKQLKEKWQENVKKYESEKKSDYSKNVRAQLAIDIAKARKAIKDAKSAGEDTTELEAQLAELNKQLTEFVPGKLVSADVKAKAAILRAKIANFMKDKRIARNETLKEVRQEVRENVRDRIQQRVENRNLNKPVESEDTEDSADTDASVSTTTTTVDPSVTISTE